MGKLEITYEITGFDRILYKKSPSWENCTFRMEEESKATLCIWEENINDLDQLKLAEQKLKGKIKSFVLAMEFKLMLPLEYKMVNIKKPEINGYGFFETLIWSDKLEVVCNPTDPPNEMPSLPFECEKWVMTLAETHKFGNFVEEQLKRQYLIIEELWDEFRNEFSELNRETVRNLKWIRNFVSHPICKNEETVKFISSDKDCPSTAIFKSNDKQAVKFLINDISHRNYVARYEAKARDITRSLVEKKIAKIKK